MTQRQALVIDAGHQAFDELDATDIPALAYDATGTAAAAVAALSSVYQPLDSDLTAIAALTTTSYGRAFLALANAGAGRTALGLGTAAVAATGDFDAAGAAAAAQSASQPVDSDLTAIAALTTTTYGRSLLEAANAAGARTLLGLGTLATQSGTFSGTSSGTNTGDQTVPAFATPGLTLGTSNAAGAASTVIRSDATILTFDATDPSTQAFSDAAAVGVATVAARRDHKHGMPASPSAALGAGFFGDGSDGAITLQQTTAAPAWATKAGVGTGITFTLTRDLYGTTVDFDDSAGNYLVKSGGFRICASTSLNIDAGVTVHNDGLAANVGTGAGPVSAGTIGRAVGGGSDGGINTTAAQATAVTNSAATTSTTAVASGGAGGAATGGGTGGGVAGGTILLAAASGAPRNLAQAWTCTTPGSVIFAGGAGGTGGNATGGGTAKGGGGGGGAGIVGIYAKVLTNSGVIRAQGGAGGAGTAGNGTGSGGGAGGGGGVVIVVYGTGSTVGTLTVTGGAGGGLTGTGATGATGSTGLTYQFPL